MSTVPEIVAAHHSGMKVICLSLISNKVVMSSDDDQEHANHKEVIMAVSKRTNQVKNLVNGIITSLCKEGGVLKSLPDLPIISLDVHLCDEKKVTFSNMWQVQSGLGFVLGILSCTLLSYYSPRYSFSR